MDPRTYGPQQRRSNLSDLRQAQTKASQGEVVNACPFGCTTAQLDDLGYCDHLVGIALPGRDGTKPAQMESVVECDDGRRRVLGSRTVPIPQGAKLVRITTCHRVYVERTEKGKKVG